MSDSYYGKSPTPKQLVASDIQNGAIDSTKLAVGLGQTVTTISSSGSITAAQTGVILVNAASGAVAITLPLATAGTPLSYKFVRIDTVFGNLVTITRAGSDTIGLFYISMQISIDNNVLDLASDGTSNWEVSGAVKTPVNGRKNAVINGNFSIWQRGTGFSQTATYTADRWLIAPGTGGSPAVTITRQAHTLGQALIPNEPTYFYRWVQGAQATATNPSLEQRIESVRTFAGKTVTLSFYANVAAGTLSLVPQFIQGFGTGGSPSGNATTTSPAMTITTTMTKYVWTAFIPSISGKTIGTNNNDYLSIQFQFPLSTTFTINIAQVQVEEGSIATAFEYRPKAEEVGLCQRYFTKTFPAEQQIGTAAGVAGGITWETQATAAAWYVEWVYPVTMRGTPSLVTYNPTAGNANWRDTTGAADVTSAVNDVSDRKANITGAATTLNHICVIHASADAEL